MKIEVTDIQLIAVYGMVDAIAELEPNALILHGNEIIQRGRAIAYQGNYALMREMILRYLTPKIREIAEKEDAVRISVGYKTADKELTLNVRNGDGVKYFCVDAVGHIREGV